MQTETVNLGDGDSAEMYVKLRHGTSKAIQRIYQPYINSPEQLVELEALVADRVAYVAKLFEIVGSSADHLGANDALILGQVASWTFGEVSQAVLDDLPAETIAILLLEANRLCGELPLAESGVGK